MSYLSWKQTITADFSEKNISSLYNDGFLFTRIDKGVMDQTRSVRINLEQFELSSENRRILKKTEGLVLDAVPLPYSNYHWSIGKMGKDFYEQKFGDGTFSANKLKELMTDTEKSHFNLLLRYTLNNEILGYSICYQNDTVLHYCYPFYNLETAPKDIGMGMMLRAIMYAKEHNKKHVYLGSAQRPSDTYKLQFTGIEWFNGKNWEKNQEELKILLQK